MKYLFIIVLYLLVAKPVFTQEILGVRKMQNQYNVVKSIRFSDNQYVPVSVKSFLSDSLQVSKESSFEAKFLKSSDKRCAHERYEQFYNGIKVAGGGYTFHFKDGNMTYAHGNYIPLHGIDINPTLTKENARDIFAKYEGIPIDSIIDFTSELLILSSPNNDITPVLAYKVIIYANVYKNEIGFVDAQSGKILFSVSGHINYYSTGTLHTLYNGIRLTNTQFYDGFYHLADSSRNAIIHVWDLNGNLSIYYKSELSDNDNNWTYNEHKDNNKHLSFDVYWALQMIYDRLNTAHNRNSFNDLGMPINAYINYNDTDNAYWSSTDNALLFVKNHSNFNPLVSLDVIAHEYGHGITQYNIGWNDGSLRYGLTDEQLLDLEGFNEGMSDIWAVIMKYRISTPQTSSIWLMGEGMPKTKYCLRDIINPSNGLEVIALKYGDDRYQNGEGHIRGGVFSRWFYYLVEGRTDDNGDRIYGIGMDKAESLVVKAVYEGYLYHTTSYTDIRDAFVNAALDSGDTLLAQQTESAWYAVGVGNRPSQINISGSSSLCDTHDYSIDNLPTGANVSWALSVNGSSTAAQLSVDTPAVHQCRITRSSSQSGSFSATLTATITYQNDTIKVLSKSLDGPAHFVSVPYTIINTVGSGGTGGMVGSYNNIDIKPNTMYYLSSSYFIGKTLTLQGSPIIGNYMFTPAGINGYYVMVPQDGNMIALLSDGCTTTTWSFWGHSNAYNMSISGGNGQLTVEITQEDSSSSENRDAGTQQKVPASKELPAWTLEVYEATTFKKMSSAEVNGNSRTLDTSSWPKGIYIVRAIVDKEILSEKITIQ